MRHVVSNLSEVKKGEKAVDTKTIEAVAQAFVHGKNKENTWRDK